MTVETPPPSQLKQPIDKAYSIASIKACIPTPLDLDKLNYNSWSALFQRFCRTYEVHHHLQAPSTTTTFAIDSLHENNDSLVVMWMYSTISPKLVDMVVDVDTSAHDVWKRLKDLFHNNKDARVTQLDNEIRNMTIGSSSVTDFSQDIKSKADRLANLDSPVKDTSLVTYVVNGIRNNSTLLHTSSFSPTVLVASTTPHDTANTMSTSGFDVCRNYQRNSCSYGARCPTPNTQLTTPAATASGNAPTTNTHHMVPWKASYQKPLARMNCHVTTTLPIPRSHLHALALVPRPANVNVVRSMWLFRHKYNADGSLSRYKARLVANGRSQQQVIDYDETFSPIIKPATIRTFLSLAVTRDWTIHQLDVKNAFLHGQLSKTIYMHQPPGFVDSTHLDYHSKTDTSLFVYHRGSDIAYLLLYVDDIVLTTSSTVLLQRFITLLHGEFAMTDLDSLNYFLGISAQRLKSGLFLSQSKFAAKILERAHMQHCNPCKTLVDTESKLGSDGDPVSDPTLYRNLASALQYLTFTRPDISYAVQHICLYMHDPRDPHFNALKRILRYVCGTPNHGLQLHRHVTLSRSSAEAEYRDVANVVAETAWIRNLLLELRAPLITATLVYYDNVSDVYLSTNPVQHQRTKHIEINIHYVRDYVTSGQVRVLHVPSRFQYADIFTKGLPTALFL
ncbi:ribonuclease H-like domain-containing protein [Tanacetum coccineum]|uniref:Ribonuclease H-like domain-containing protein n=1 Tax=Tanacetum coccineum TaxID=301880 RepID=A0ABQ5H3Q0_9ASTR